MKMKFNFGVLKGKKVKFFMTYAFDGKEKLVEVPGIIKKIKERNGKYKFTFEDGRVLEIVDMLLLRMKIRREDDVISFVRHEQPNILSGLAGFTMYDTYGFPVEITQEILAENGYELDVKGYELLKELQKEASAGSFKNNDGWNSK